MEAYERLTKVLEVSRLSADQIRSTLNPVPERLRADVRATGVAVQLPGPLQPTIPLDAALQRRTTARQYAPDYLPLEELGTLLRAAEISDLSAWPQERDLGVKLTYLVHADRVTDVAQATYRYDPAAHALVPIGPALSPEELPDLLLQQDFAGAPCLILVTGNLAAATACMGAHGHRQLLFRAGMAAHQAWIAAICRGLVGAVFTGVFLDVLRRIGQVDGYTCAPLLALTVGSPVTGTLG